MENQNGLSFPWSPGAYCDQELSQFTLPYDAVQQFSGPDVLLLEFFSTLMKPSAVTLGPAPRWNGKPFHLRIM
jgi:hypothetical protein